MNSIEYLCDFIPKVYSLAYHRERHTPLLCYFRKTRRHIRKWVAVAKWWADLGVSLMLPYMVSARRLRLLGKPTANSLLAV